MSTCDGTGHRFPSTLEESSSADREFPNTSGYVPEDPSLLDSSTSSESESLSIGLGGGDDRTLSCGEETGGDGYIEAGCAFVLF